MGIKQKIEVDFKITPESLADVFCDMNADEQASFFNHVSDFTSKWDGNFCFQLQAIQDSKALESKGRRVMASIGEYSEKS